MGIKSNRQKFALSSMMIMMIAIMALMTTTTTTAFAQPEEPKGTIQCPDGYEFNRGICEADPVKGCGTSPVVPNQELCITGSLSGTNIPVSPEDPCGVSGEVYPFGFRYIYPHPYDPNPRVCAGAEPMALLCPGEDFNTGTPISPNINPETGKCEVKPGRTAVDATCPEGIVEGFENGYCVMRQVQTCPEGSVLDEDGGNCDDPNTPENDNIQTTFVCPDGSDPDDSNGCRFRPGEGKERPYNT